MKHTHTSRFGYTFTTYTAKAPYKVENDFGFFKVLIVYHSPVGRVVYDKKVEIKKV
jgi:hypothetical protein